MPALYQTYFFLWLRFILLILIHELAGHYLFAKILGCRPIFKIVEYPSVTAKDGWLHTQYGRVQVTHFWATNGIRWLNKLRNRIIIAAPLIICIAICVFSWQLFLILYFASGGCIMPSYSDWKGIVSGN